MSLEARIEKSGEGAKLGAFILHGYGASMDDLFPLKDFFSFGEPVDWYFPNGPLSVPISPWMEGRAWFKIDFEKLEKAMQSQSVGKIFEREAPEEFEEIYENVKSWIIEQSQDYDKIIIGGFSQGSMLALRLACEVPKVKGAILLSSALLSLESLTKVLEKRDDLFIFQSHGKGDTVLPFDGAMDLKRILDSGPWTNTFVEFSGGHEIPPEVIGEANKFVRENL
ncbi:MAG: alpha/beta hydrolase [Bacteriovoracaceae bacterium]